MQVAEDKGMRESAELLRHHLGWPLSTDKVRNLSTCKARNLCPSPACSHPLRCVMCASSPRLCSTPRPSRLTPTMQAQVGVSHVLIKHSGSRRASSKRDPTGLSFLPTVSTFMHESSTCMHATSTFMRERGRLRYTAQVSSADTNSQNSLLRPVICPVPQTRHERARKRFASVEDVMSFRMSK